MAISLVNLAMLRTFEGNFAAKFDLQVSRLQQNFQTFYFLKTSEAIRQTMQIILGNQIIIQVALQVQMQYLHRQIIPTIFGYTLQGCRYFSFKSYGFKTLSTSWQFSVRRHFEREIFIKQFHFHIISVCLCQQKDASFKFQQKVYNIFSTKVCTFFIKREQRLIKGHCGPYNCCFY